MRSTARWTGGHRVIVDNDRGADVELDLPVDLGGGGQLPTALELAGMSLAGCVGTLYTHFARERSVEFSELEVMTYQEKPTGESTFVSAMAEVAVKSDAPLEALQHCLDLTAGACPMVNLFRQAGITLDLDLVKL